jgi:type VI secretion system ImpH/TssG family protein
MAAEGRRDSASIKDELFEHPARFEFFQAVRLLRKLRSGDFRVAAADPSEELVRFRADISLAFPTAEITDLVAPGEQEPGAVMSVPFMGVASPSSFGSLPTRYVEQLLDEEREKNSAPRDFLDLFNHRIISLFFRAWEKYRLDAQYEADEDRRYYEQAIFSLIGMGTDGLRQRLRLDDRALLSRAGLLARTPMPATSLEGLLESYFDVPVSVEQFRATWYPLELDERPGSRLRAGRAGETLPVQVPPVARTPGLEPLPGLLPRRRRLRRPGQPGAARRDDGVRFRDAHRTSRRRGSAASTRTESARSLPAGMVDLAAPARGCRRRLRRRTETPRPAARTGKKRELMEAPPWP